MLFPLSFSVSKSADPPFAAAFSFREFSRSIQDLEAIITYGSIDVGDWDPLEECRAADHVKLTRAGRSSYLAPHRFSQSDWESADELTYSVHAYELDAFEQYGRLCPPPAASLHLDFADPGSLLLYAVTGRHRFESLLKHFCEPVHEGFVHSFYRPEPVARSARAYN